MTFADMGAFAIVSCRFAVHPLQEPVRAFARDGAGLNARQGKRRPSRDSHVRAEQRS
jgi:hypothetical protein